ncbi:MAG: amidophosphoribosyltransferase, partial [Clostridia bacterium]|nr:amidophosphoribosyltransferase [Clostridia bacterium]
MGGFFGITSKKECVSDVFFGVDYHSHLGNARAGMAALNDVDGFQREIHNVENSPFRTKFDNISSRLKGNACIGCISDSEPQPLLIKSKFGIYAITTVGYISNCNQLVDEILKNTTGIFQSMSGNKVNSNEVIAALIESKEDIVEGIRFAQNSIVGSLSILLLLENGNLIVAR